MKVHRKLTMQLEIPTPEPVKVGRQESLSIQLIDHLFLYHKCTKKKVGLMEILIMGGEYWLNFRYCSIKP